MPCAQNWLANGTAPDTQFFCELLFDFDGCACVSELLLNSLGFLF